MTVGFVTLGIAFVVSLQVFTAYFFAQQPTPGWTSTFLAIMFLGGVQSLCIGILGEYIARIYREVKRRPLYLVAATANLAGPQPPLPPERDERLHRSADTVHGGDSR
jgi:dolichol-phosphate mannosyltransferase